MIRRIVLPFIVSLVFVPHVLAQSAITPTGQMTSDTVTVIHASTTLTTKSVTPGTTVAPGTPVTITVTETNTGDSTITNVSVTGTGCSPWTGGSTTLAAGESTDFSCTFTPGTSFES